ncbi:hypothetical protein HYALB_00005944 [Hymenoscyphus albidus]|uniref:Spo12-like protein n=1 Tax=Hymenoscyphus albidus TaxID=595503 RepID=A0A9N9Q2R5_9HELO|nr:hypothetical protein HYALB_00005944 [Hymenoscyphus albidus]
MSSNILADKDINASTTGAATNASGKVDANNMDYHRQMLQNKLDQQDTQQTYISPSDTIMSPCTAKLSAYRNKQVGKAKPKSLFAKTSAKNLQGNSGGLFGKQIPNANTEKPVGGQ